MYLLLVQDHTNSCKLVLKFTVRKLTQVCVLYKCMLHVCAVCYENKKYTEKNSKMCSVHPKYNGIGKL